MSGRLIELDKQSVVCPFGVGETWIGLFAKIVLKSTGSEATRVCQDGKLCARLKAVIDGTVHGVQAIWYTNSTKEDWGFMIVDTKTYRFRISTWVAFKIWGGQQILCISV